MCQPPPCETGRPDLSISVNPSGSTAWVALLSCPVPSWHITLLLWTDFDVGVFFFLCTSHNRVHMPATPELTGIPYTLAKHHDLENPYEARLNNPVGCLDDQILTFQKYVLLNVLVPDRCVI